MAYAGNACEEEEEGYSAPHSPHARGTPEVHRDNSLPEKVVADDAERRFCDTASSVAWL